MKINFIPLELFFRYKTNNMKKLFVMMAILTSLVMNAQQKSFYDFKVTDINGEVFNFATLKGKKVMIVNVASKCGYTKQYEGLQALYEKHKENDFVIIGFPANNFLRQEPGTNEEIKTFCTLNYGVTFPMMQKISVKGDDIHPVYKWLTTKSLNGKQDSSVGWNFQKYLIGSNGQLEMVLPTKTKPNDDIIVKWITNK